MPIILELYQMAHMVSKQNFMATKSAPKTDVSMVDCLLEYQVINFFQINYDSHPRCPSLFVSSMIAAYEHSYIPSFSFGGGALGWRASTAPS